MSDSHSGLATLAQNIKLGIDNRLKELHTALPGIIQSFDPELQTVSVQPAIKRIFKSISEDSQDTIPMELPILINVPILYPRGGGFSLTFPISVGDECLLLFSERSIDRWHIFGGTNEPGAKRFHSLSDAIAIVGLSSVPNKIPNYDDQNVVLRKDDESAYVRIGVDSDIDIYTESNLIATVTGDINASCENIEVQASSTAIVTCPESTFNGNVTINGNLTVSTLISAPTIAAGSSLTVAAKEMSGHIHPQGDDSNGNTEQNTGAPI